MGMEWISGEAHSLIFTTETLGSKDKGIRTKLSRRQPIHAEAIVRKGENRS